MQVLQRYQEVPAGPQASKLALLDLVAVTIHAIAGFLFEPDGADTPCSNLREDEGAVSRRIAPWPTTFAVEGFTDPERFAAEIADVAGYWAKDIIFSGFILFDRGENAIGVSTSSAAGT